MYLSIGSANWNRRSLTLDLELKAEVVDGDTVMSRKGVIVGKYQCPFRIRKFQETTGLSYKKLNTMTFIETADQLRLAVTIELSMLARNTFQCKNHFFVITRGNSKDYLTTW
ncbi:unnamed protein product [Peronospora farinosa]|uniref:CDP-diacylglycerol--glycerol-3-phosphate 3-phosphatidyltransferase n=1 Tax=Peronospora farinosa TaxID=134698 RepID=A0AAV0TYI2_9STRA|nr:unnamed protein product [Peronospora farinosa]CAI5729454.1 unnamed protein product [Peronospora farinosa]